MTELLIFAQVVSTFMLLGVIWMVQLVQYPAFRFVGPSDFVECHAAHSFWITPIVAPAMIIELISSILLLIFPPQNIEVIWFWIGLILTVVVWLSTMFVQVPIHNRLANGVEPGSINRLINSNWIRTIAWSLRAGLVLYILARTIKV